MHCSTHSIDSTPKTAKSSNLSSIMEPNPVKTRMSDHFIDLDDNENAAELMRISEDRTPDQIDPLEIHAEDKEVPDQGVLINDPVDQMQRESPKMGQETNNEMTTDILAVNKAPTHCSPQHSRKYTDTDAASLIQRNWVNQNYKKKVSMKKAEKEDGSVGSRRSKLEDERETVNLNLPDDQLLYAHLTRASYVFESPLDKFLQSSEDVQITSSNEDLDLKEPWIAPSIEFAKNAASLLHPRRMTPNRAHYSVLKTTTGRHCVIKGWGEQCDLFHEGAFSSFAIFGPGVTNYFKFIKFCFWIFVGLSVLYLPCLILAVNGGGRLSDLATTTLGNVVSFNSTEYMDVPECHNDAAYTCRAKMENVGLVWESIDIFACIFVFIGFVWLRFFEKAEYAQLRKRHISPADYTVLVSNLPAECSEADLRVYFARLMNEAVTDIVFVYNDEEDIATSKRRGALVKKRYHLTQQYRYHYAFVSKERKPSPQALQKTIPERNTGTKDFLDGKLSRKGLLIHLSQERSQVTKAIKALDKKCKLTSLKETEKPLSQAYVTFHAHAAKNQALKKHKVTLFNFLKPDPNIFLKV